MQCTIYRFITEAVYYHVCTNSKVDEEIRNFSLEGLYIIYKICTAVTIKFLKTLHWTSMHCVLYKKKVHSLTSVSEIALRSPETKFKYLIRILLFILKVQWIAARTGYSILYSIRKHEFIKINYLLNNWSATISSYLSCRIIGIC